MIAVVRVGDMVRRMTGPWSPAVHGLLRRLDARGFIEASRLLGLDDRGREIRTYVDEDAGLFSHERIVPSYLCSDQVLIHAATLLRRFHDVTIGLRLPTGVEWQPAWPSPTPHEAICHNDFAPYNCIFRNGRPIATIDLDGAAPRAWDLAYAAYTFIPLYTDHRCRVVGMHESPDRGHHVRLVCDAYGLTDRGGYVRMLEERVRDVVTMVRAQAEAGDGRFQRKIDEGHLSGYLADVAYLRQFREELQGALEV